MDIRSLCLLAGIIIILISESSAGSNCDTGDINEAIECTGLPDLHRLDLDYSKVAQQVCRANRSKEVEDCIEWLNTYYYCQNDELFQIAVQTDKFLEHLDFFCSQSEVYVKNGLCIAQANTASLPCSADAWGDIDTMTGEEGMTVAEVFLLFCRPLLVIASCHTNAVARLCGGEAATFVDKYFELKLHYCNKATTSTSLSTQLGTTTQLHLLDSITQGTTTSPEFITQETVTSQDSFNGAAGIRQSTVLFILFYISIFE